MKAHPLCGAVLLVLSVCISAPSSPVEAPITLEIPEVDAHLAANSFATIPNAEITHFRIRIERDSSTILFGSIFTKINTGSANVIMTTTSTADGILCHFDLNLRSGFKLQLGRNSIELSYKDKWQRVHYASFLLQTTDRPMYLRRSPVNTPPEQHTAGKYAVIVGVSQYKFSGAGVPNLQFADRDARQFRDFLLSPEGGSFRPENIKFLINEDATSQNVRSALFTFLTRPGPNDLVVIYFSGHGGADPHDPRNLYLITYDTDPRDLGGTAFPMWQLQDVYTRILKARRVVTFADSCHSYGISGETSGQQQNNLINQYLAAYASQADRAAITASDISELSFESDQWGGGHGVFTWFLLKGLSGEADLNRDGTVTAGELFPFLRERVRTATGGKQNPSAFPGLAENLALAGIGVRTATD